MNLRIGLTTAVLCCSCFALAASDAVAQQKSLKDQLVGTWTLASWETIRPDGSKVDRFGSNPNGIEVFGVDGHFVLVLVRADVPKLAGGSRYKATDEEAQAIVRGSVAYFGTYTVDEANKTVVYHIDASTFPNQIGIEQKRVITSLTAGELQYKNLAATSGGQWQVAFKRAN